MQSALDEPGREMEREIQKRVRPRLNSLSVCVKERERVCVREKEREYG